MVRPSIGAAAARPAVLVIGAATRDIVHAEPGGWRLGGGVSYGAMTAVRLGASVRALIGVDAAAADAPELSLLRRAGVEVELVPLRHGPVMENRNTPGGRVQLVAQASDPLTPEALPAAWRGAPAVLLAPVAGELEDAWAAAFSSRALIGLAWQGLLRRLLPGRPIEPLPLRGAALITRADVALVSADDVRAGSAPLAELLPRAGQQLVVSHGERGGTHAQRARRGFRWRHVPPIAAGRAVDTTGAGDAFLAAWLVGLLAARLAGSGDAWRPLALAAATASLSVRGSGIAALAGLGEVCRLLEASHLRADRSG